MEGGVFENQPSILLRHGEDAEFPHTFRLRYRRATDAFHSAFYSETASTTAFVIVSPFASASATAVLPGVTAPNTT